MNIKFFTTAFLAASVILFSGCPTGIGYPAGYPGKEKIDKDLVGTWTTPDEEKEIKLVRISRIDDFSLKAEVLETGSMYSLEAKEFTGWCTEIGGMKFVYWQPVSETEHDYFLYSYKIKGNNMESYDVSLLDGGIDAVTSVESYRDQIATSIKMTDGISDTIKWSRN